MSDETQRRILTHVKLVTKNLVFWTNFLIVANAFLVQLTHFADFGKETGHWCVNDINLNGKEILY